MSNDQLIAKLYKKIQKGRVFDFKSDREFKSSVAMDKFPTNGIYLMFERGQKIKGFNRITRVGINKTRTLLDRLNRHCNGSIRNSIFRKHLFRILGSNEEIGVYIQSNISFCVISDPENKRVELERKIIGLLSSLMNDIDLLEWMGRKSEKECIKKSGLWNVHHVFGNAILDESDLDYIEKNLIK